MPTVRNLLEDSWLEQRLHPKSIAHLLHWDLAYLWVLAKEPHYRPQHWAERIIAWERLLKLLLSGRLEVRQSKIERPLLNYTERFGISEVRLLHVRGREGVSREPVGLVSPIVLVRPFPDGDDPKQLPDLPDVEWEDGRLQHCLALLISSLHSRMDPAKAPLTERSIQNHLLTILRRYQGGRATPCSTVTIRIPVHRSVSFAPGTAAFADDLDVSFVSDGAPQYVPRCTEAGCGVPLTFAENTPPWHLADDEHLAVTCRNGHPQRIRLDKLYVWRRPLTGGTFEFVCWSDAASSLDHLAAREQAMLPPVPVTETGQIVFRWNPGFVDGDSRNVTLRIHTGAFPVRLVSFHQDALYGRLLVPGSVAEAPAGLPIRYDWRDAWQDHQSVPLPGGVQFSNVRIRGRHYPLRLTYDGSAWIDRRPNLFLGIYPRRMHANWKPYRLAALGDAEQSFRVRAPGASGDLGRVDLGWVQEVQGWPNFCSVESIDNKSGATYDPNVDPPVSSVSHRQSVSIGIDFGTSTSVVYFAAVHPGAPTTQQCGIQASDYASLIHWIAPGPPPTWQSWLLPSASTGAGDPFLIPSTLWKTPQGTAYIRWTKAPLDNSKLVHGFKWDSGILNYTPERHRFLEEILFFALPVMLSRLGDRQAVPALKLGFSYPLAFDDAQRGGFKTLLRDVRQWCENALGYSCSTTSVNESLASVKAVAGLPKTTDLFLVADMGGRTLDVALFSVGPSIHQIGSIDFGGEVLLERVAARKAGRSTGPEFEQEYWRLHDGIQSGTGAVGEGDLRQRIERFHVMALEFLRTMLLCHRDSGNPGRIELVLIGNGWRLQDLLAGNQDPARHLFEYTQLMLKAFEIPDVAVFSGPLKQIHSSKHWVAIGALLAALGNDESELDKQDAYPSRLPSGRAATINAVPIAWNDLVGDGGIQTPQWLNAPHYDIDVDLASAPSMTPQWQAQLDRAIPVDKRYPRVSNLAESMKNTIKLGRLGRGPLELLLETHWKNEGL
jgi:hypothetical protein